MKSVKYRSLKTQDWKEDQVFLQQAQALTSHIKKCESHHNNSSTKRVVVLQTNSTDKRIATIIGEDTGKNEQTKKFAGKMDPWERSRNQRFRTDNITNQKG